MKMYKLRKLKLDEAVTNLENAVKDLLKKAQWYSPYNGYSYNNKVMKSPVNELRIPLLELKLAKKERK